jgi:CubicO group peptidase (beta-lactamase class C family)
MFQVLTIIGMQETSYHPTSDKLKIAPGGFTDQVAWGTAFNKLTHILNDTAGNGGLFSTVSDIIKYTQLLLNKGKVPFQFRVFQE